jgi:hypothetical protein
MMIFVNVSHAEWLYAERYYTEYRNNEYNDTEVINVFILMLKWIMLNVHLAECHTEFRNEYWVLL